MASFSALSQSTHTDYLDAPNCGSRYGFRVSHRWKKWADVPEPWHQYWTKPQKVSGFDLEFFSPQSVPSSALEYSTGDLHSGTDLQKLSRLGWGFRRRF